MKTHISKKSGDSAGSRKGSKTAEKCMSKEEVDHIQNMIKEKAEQIASIHLMANESIAMLSEYEERRDALGTARRH